MRSNCGSEQPHSLIFAEMSQGLKAEYKSTLQGECEQGLSESLYCTVRHCLPRICWTVTTVAWVLLLCYPTEAPPHLLPGACGNRAYKQAAAFMGKMISSFTSLIYSSCQWLHDMQGLKQSHTSFGRWGSCFDRLRRINFPFKYQLSPQTGCMTIYVCRAIFFSEKQVLLFALWIFKMEDYCFLNKQ